MGATRVHVRDFCITFTQLSTGTTSPRKHRKSGCFLPTNASVCPNRPASLASSRRWPAVLLRQWLTGFCSVPTRSPKESMHRLWLSPESWSSLQRSAAAVLTFSPTTNATPRYRCTTKAVSSLTETNLRNQHSWSKLLSPTTACRALSALLPSKSSSTLSTRGWLSKLLKTPCARPRRHQCPLRHLR